MKRSFFAPKTCLFAAIISFCVSAVVLGRFSFSFASDGSFEDSITSVAQTVGKAVVSISAEHVTRFSRNRSFNRAYGSDEALRRFFEEFFGEIPEREYRRTGLGSGVIIDKQGYILTNQHVVENADKLTVILPDGRQFSGSIVGADPRSDLAVIKIKADDLPVANLGDSDKLKIGQWVVAIGNPFGFALQNPEPTVTVGVVSALHRTLGITLSRGKDYNDLIQTDAAINPGNSGGPLVDLKGDVIGINVAIFSTTGGNQGVGFAIPVNNAKRVISSLIAGKKVPYGWIGITVQDMSEDLSEYFGSPSRKGVLVAKVLKNGPGDKGGLRDGDVIVKLNGAAITDVKQLLRVIAQSQPGVKVPVTVIRDKKEVSLNVEIGSRPEDGAEASESLIRSDPMQELSWRGMKVADITPEIARKYSLSSSSGVAVVFVEKDSPADAAGIVEGDVIEEINRQAVTDTNAYSKITAGSRGDALVGVSRGYVILKDRGGKAK